MVDLHLFSLFSHPLHDPRLISCQWRLYGVHGPWSDEELVVIREVLIVSQGLPNEEPLGSNSAQRQDFPFRLGCLCLGTFPFFY